MNKRLSEIDFILMQLEDVAHGEEGKKITHARRLLAEFSDYHDEAIAILSEQVPKFAYPNHPPINKTK